MWIMRTSHDEYIGQILDVIADDRQVSQRALSLELGIALGLTNLLLKRLVMRGLIRVAKVHPRRVRYFLTPAGIAEKARMSQRAFEGAISRYRAARSRLESTFRSVSASFPAGTEVKPILFYGTGEVAEIGYVCLQDSDLQLVGAIDDSGKSRFFEIPAYASADAAITAAVTALLDRLLHHAHVLKCGPRSWRTKVHTDLRTEDHSK